MRADLIGRAVVPAAALGALASGAPQAVTGGLALAGLAVTAERLVRLRRTGPADRVLVALGGLISVLVLTGIGLDAVGVALRPVSWAAALVVLSVVGLAAAAVLPGRVAGSGGDPDEPVAHPAGAADRRAALLVLPWVALAVLVAVVSVRMSATSLAEADAAPVQMSFGRVAGTKVQVVVSSSDAVGPLEVRTSAEGNEISYPLFTVGADGTSTTTVSLPRTGRYVITLSYPDQTQPLRTLVLDR